MASSIAEELNVSRLAYQGAAEAMGNFQTLAQAAQWDCAEVMRAVAVAKFEASLDAYSRACHLVAELEQGAKRVR